MRKCFKILPFVALLMLASCDGSQRRTLVDQAVWSEDSSEIAAVVMHFDEKKSNNPLDGTTLKSNFTHQYLVQKPDGSQKRILTSELPGQNAYPLFYFKQAGYILGSYLDKNTDNMLFERYELIRLATGQVTRLNNDPYTHILPAPDGSILAQVKYFPSACQPNGSSSTTDACHAEIEFISSMDLSRQGKKQKVVFSSRDRVPEVTWTPAGQLLVSNGEETFSLKPGEDIVNSAPRPACMEPPTSSARINSQGMLVYIDDNQIKTRFEPSQPKFGCQGN